MQNSSETVAPKWPAKFTRPTDPNGCWEIMVEGEPGVPEEEGGDGIPQIDAVYIGVTKDNGMFRSIAEIPAPQGIVEDPDDTLTPGNVRLIMAAPALYAACKEAIRIMDNRPGNWDVGVADQLRQAIEHAETMELPYHE